jgi:hypothetical protein
MSIDLAKFAEAFQTEKMLRNNLVILLAKMGNQEVQDTHGPQEFGKDIVFYSTDAVGNRMLNACVVKNEKISGSVDDNIGARTVFQQVEQALDTPLINGTGENESVARVFVISPLDCSQSTMRSIQGKLKARSGQCDFLCGGRLLDRFSKHWPEFLAFESTLLGVYVASIQRAFDQEDPLTFLGAQHSLFASANKSLGRVYVRQSFHLEMFDMSLAQDLPDFSALHDPISESDCTSISKQLKLLLPLIKNPQFWESGDAATSSNVSRFAGSLADEIETEWYEKFRIEEARGNKQRGNPQDRRWKARYLLRSWIDRRDAKEIGLLIEAFRHFKALISKANESTKRAAKEGLTYSSLDSNECAAFEVVREVFRAQPEALRRDNSSTLSKFKEDLLDKVTQPLFVVAPPGYGKTSFCKWNALNDIDLLLEKRSNIFPIYVPLHQLSTRPVKNCEDAFFNTPESAELLERAKKKKHRVRLYLDGLDEVSTEERQRSLMNLASTIPTGFPAVQVVVTGRNYLSGPWLRWLNRVELSALENKQSVELVKKWLDDDQALIADFHEQLAKAATLRGLMGTPLLATLIIAVYRQRHSLPENRLKLYEVFVELMCGGWDLAKNVRRDTQFGSQLKLSVLTRLAGSLHGIARREAEENHIRAAIEQICPAIKSEWKRMLNEFLTDGLIVRGGSGSYLFSHLSFQEYLTAAELPDPQGSRSDQALRSFLRGDNWWREVLTFYLSMIKRPRETESWILRVGEQEGKASAGVESRCSFLIDSLVAAWPGWTPKKVQPRLK